MNDLLEVFSNKSNKSEEKIELEYESTTNDEGLELIEDFLRESTKQILNSKKGTDEDVKKMSSEFYSDLIQDVQFLHNQVSNPKALSNCEVQTENSRIYSL